MPYLIRQKRGIIQKLKLLVVKELHGMCIILQRQVCRQRRERL